MAYSYYIEINAYKDMYTNPEEFCNQYWMNTPIDGDPYKVEINTSNYQNE